ncbi:MAG: hypothetical protein Q8P16_00840 [bacterium]|nr:hypothetical protein [bacterium]
MKEERIAPKWDNTQILHKNLLVQTLRTSHLTHEHAQTAAEYALRAVHGEKYWAHAKRRGADKIMTESLSKQIRHLRAILDEDELVMDVLRRAELAKL